MARNEQLIRQHKLLEVLERYRFGRTLEEIRDELVEELGLRSLHTRSVRRDIEALQAAGFPIDILTVERGRVYKLGPRARSSVRITASTTELMALSLSRDLLYPLAGTPFWQGIESFWNKVRDELPSSVWEHYEKYRRILYVLGMPAKSYDAHQGMLKSLNRSILEHRVVEVQYQPIGKPVSQRFIEPYAIVFYHSSLYIIAADHDRPSGPDRVRHWKLDRFHKATALDRWFKIPDDFDLEQHVARSVGIFSGSKLRKFKIRISALAAPWVIEDPWHPDQRIDRHKDGSVTLTVAAAHDLEVIPRVLALGAEAELVSPASCRKQIAGIIAQLAGRYDD